MVFGSYLNAQNCTGFSTQIYQDTLQCPNMVLVPSIIGGTQPYTYWWSNGSTSFSVTTNPSQGPLAVYITDANGCVVGDTFNVTQNLCGQSCNVTANASLITPTSCPNSADGVATVTFTGFSGNPDIFWSNGAVGPTVSGLPVGFYTIFISDSLCSDTANVYVYSNSTGYLYVGPFGSSICQPDSIQAYFSGASGNVSFVWSTGSTALEPGMDYEPVTGPGFYSVTATYAGCEYSDSVQVGAPMSASYTSQDASCANGDAAINITVTGGVPNYYYSWSNGANTEDLSNINSGIYSVTIYDTYQCNTVIDSIVVNGGGSLFFNPIINGANCNDSLGMIYLSGAQQYQILWNNGSTNAFLQNIGSGWYGVTITGNNCTTVRNYYVPRDSSCDINISGYVYNVSFSNTCSPSGAIAVPYVMVRLMPGNILGFTNAYGMYSFSVPNTGSYTVEFVNNSSNFSSVLCPANNQIAINATTLGQNFLNNNFYLSNQNPQDLWISLSHYSTVTPGFGYWTYAPFCNVGQSAMSGTITYNYDANLVFDMVYAMSSNGSPSLTNHNTAAHTLTFSYSNLQPGACGYIMVDFETPVTLPLGTFVSNSITINPLTGDATPLNNTDIDTTTCVGSWDPNEKLVGPLRSGDERNGGVIYLADDVLDYTIHFQNLGTAPAQRVVVRDTLDSNLRIETIRNISFSHSGNLSIENGNVLVFTFNNINLPAASFDERNSQGFVKFKIDRNPFLPLGTVINNDASIYFDFNAPVETNNAFVTISEVVSGLNSDHNTFRSTVYPNPFNNLINISFDLASESNVNISLYNTIGTKVRDIQSSVLENAGTQLYQFNMNELSSGIYFLSIETNAGRSLHKIVKQ